MAEKVIMPSTSTGTREKWGRERGRGGEGRRREGGRKKGTREGKKGKGQKIKIHKMVSNPKRVKINHLSPCKTKT